MDQITFEISIAVVSEDSGSWTFRANSMNGMNIAEVTVFRYADKEAARALVADAVKDYVKHNLTVHQQALLTKRGT